MDRYPVYRALFTPSFIAGVPMMVLVLEVVMVFAFFAFGLWLALPFIFVFHYLLAKALGRDQFIISILLDLLSMPSSQRR